MTVNIHDVLRTNSLAMTDRFLYTCMSRTVCDSELFRILHCSTSTYINCMLILLKDRRTRLDWQESVIV
jgi:hypothetical protein